MSIKAHSLTGRITDLMMDKAFKAVKRNRGAAGVDKVSIQMFEANREDNLSALMRQMKSRMFRPMPLRRSYIPKGPRSKKRRPLGIPVVRDRVAQDVVRRLLQPVFEPLFHDASFGFRPGRNCHQAIEKALAYHAEGYTYVLDADIEGFFDHLPHSVIMQHVAQHVADGNVLGLVQRFLTAGVMEQGVVKPTRQGTPQGGVISPLLANIVLNQLDWVLDAAGYRFVRYADDFIVLCQTRQQAQEALTLVSQTLQELGLRLSPEKTHITTYGKGYEFLGFFLSSRSRRMRDKSVQKFKDTIRSLTQRHQNLDAQVIVKLNRVIRGVANYFAPPFATTRTQLLKLDSWVRMRLRAMKFKRKNGRDRRRLRVRTICYKWGLLTLEEFCTVRDALGHVHRVVPRHGAIPPGVAR